MRWGVCTWATKFGGALDADIPDAPALFKGRVPMEPGMGWYIKYLYDLGILGPGRKIESYPLPMEQWNTLVFREIFCEALSKKIGIGAVLAEGILAAAEKWGRLDEDLNSGALRLPAWGASWHHTLPGMDWAYGYILASGDPMFHGFFSILSGGANANAEELVNRIAAKLVPFSTDPLVLSNNWKGEDARKYGIYSAHKARFIAWSRHYNEMYNESMTICEMLLPSFGSVSPDLEHRYYQAATGDKRSIAEIMEAGRKVWNMHRAIRVMAGRHRDDEKFAPFMHMPGATFRLGATMNRPIYQDGKWSFENQNDMYLDREGVEQFKTHYYAQEGWDTSNGWPTRKALEGLGLGRVADVMAAKNRLGK
jgi:aldehyde:ferredoxin oxidoreductase